MKPRTDCKGLSALSGAEAVAQSCECVPGLGASLALAGEGPRSHQPERCASSSRQARSERMRATAPYSLAVSELALPSSPRLYTP